MKKSCFTILIVCICAACLRLSAQSIQTVFVQGGTFNFKTEKVIVTSFKIATHEITNGQFADFLNAARIDSNGMYDGKLLINIGSNDLQLERCNNTWKPEAGFDKHPMVMVSYYGAVACSKWMGGRLPTEIEWTYAATGGNYTHNYLFAGGNSYDSVGWYSFNSNKQSHVVGQKTPNELSIYDMSGNAWEWCGNDTLPSGNDFCVHMGGSWFAGEQPGKISAHYCNTPMHFSNSVGFRVLFETTKKT